MSDTETTIEVDAESIGAFASWAWKILVVFLIIILIWSSFYTIEETEDAIVTNLGGEIHAVETDAGFKFKRPWFLQKIRKFKTSIQATESSKFSASTKNLLPVTATVSVQYRLNSDEVVKFYTDFISHKQFSGKLRRIVESSVKVGIAGYDTNTINQNRTNVIRSIREEIQRVIDKEYSGVVFIEVVALENIQFEQSYLNAVKDKEERKQAYEKEQESLKIVELEAQRKEKQAQSDKVAQVLRAQGEAEAKVVQATAEAEAIVINEDAQAKNIKAVGEAQAEAYRKQAQALATGADGFVKVRTLEEWNGEVPTTLVDGQGGGNSVFPLLNLNKPAVQ